MDILDNFLILLIHVICFFAGLLISDRYHDKMESIRKDAVIHEEYALRLQNARIQSQDYAAYVAAPVPAKRKYVPFGARFEESLRKNGRATQLVNKEMPVS